MKKEFYTMQHINTRTFDMIKISMFTALICVCSVITVSIGPVPVNMALLGIFLSVGLLGMFKGFLSVALFIALGAFGLPVFAGFKAGFAVLAGPTGGYITGYLLAAAVAGFGIKFFKSKELTVIIFMTAGLLICYLFGTVWFVISTNADVSYAVGVCVFPFVPFDAVKIVISRLVCRQVFKNRYIRGFLEV